MSRELFFDGYWEGYVEYTCDCCHKAVRFRFDDEESAKDHKRQRAALRKKRGWITPTKVEGVFNDFCTEACKNKYIRNNTF